jgi:DNA-binding HxlR family transcriptional regulator
MRQYNDPCGVARALNLVGERWALLIIRELLLGPKRFTDLRVGLFGVSPNVLSQRLDTLSERGIVEQVRLGPPINADVYQLTVVGEQLEPVLIALADWGSRAQPPTGGAMSVDSLLLAMRTRVDLERSHRPGTYQLLIGDDSIAVHLTDTRLTMQRRLAPEPIVTLSLEPGTLRALMFEGLDLQEAIDADEVHISGDLAAAKTFLDLFERPKLIES